MTIQNESAAAPEIVWGAAGIAEIIGRSGKSVFGMLEAGKLPGARRIGGRWCFRPSVFFASFGNAA